MERSPEEDEADHDAEDDDDRAQNVGGQAPGDAGADVAADDRGRREDEDVDPVDLAGDRERDDGDTADDRRDRVLDRADPGHRLVEDEAERGDEHDAEGGAEVPAVHGPDPDDGVQADGAPLLGHAPRMADDLAQLGLEREDGGGAQDEERDDDLERAGRRGQQQHAAGRGPDHGGRDEREQAAGARQVGAAAHDAGDVPGEDGHAVGDVGGYRAEAGRE